MQLAQHLARRFSHEPALCQGNPWNLANLSSNGDPLVSPVANFCIKLLRFQMKINPAVCEGMKAGGGTSHCAACPAHREDVETWGHGDGVCPIPCSVQSHIAQHAQSCPKPASSIATRVIFYTKLVSGFSLLSPNYPFIFWLSYCFYFHRLLPVAMKSYLSSGD